MHNTKAMKLIFLLSFGACMSPYVNSKYIATNALDPSLVGNQKNLEIKLFFNGQPQKKYQEKGIIKTESYNRDTEYVILKLKQSGKKHGCDGLIVKIQRDEQVLEAARELQDYYDYYTSSCIVF